jgi:hypothetical protein
MAATFRLKFQRDYRECGWADHLFDPCRAAPDPHAAAGTRSVRWRDRDRLPVAKSTLSQHFNVLTGANLIRASRSGAI